MILRDKVPGGAQRGTVFFFAATRKKRQKNDHFWVILWSVGTMISGTLQEARKLS